MRQGFTLIELVVILLIVGVISAFVTARMSTSVEQTRAVYDQLITQVQYARKTAVAQRRPVFVRIQAAQSRLCYDDGGGCDGVASPTGEVPFSIAIPPAVSVTTATFQFDGLGRPRTSGGALAGTQLIAVTGDGSHQFSVEQETGYVR
jgi:MSHA pilin protein MshC